jgi:hypothetical protein
MNAARSSKQRRRGGGEWRFVYGPHNQIVGVVEQRPDGLWLAMAASGRQLGMANTFEAAAALVQQETAR